MKAIAYLLLTFAVVAVSALTVVAAAKRPSELWAYFHFDGHNLVPADPSLGPCIAIRPGVVPVLLLSGQKPDAVPLPAGTGAIAGICYLESTGGRKKGGGIVAVPVAGYPVKFAVEYKFITAVESDQNGYFCVTLPAGNYRIGQRRVDIVVESGKTKLIPLRVGRRMVD